MVYFKIEQTGFFETEGNRNEKAKVALTITLQVELLNGN